MTEYETEVCVCPPNITYPKSFPFLRMMIYDSASAAMPFSPNCSSSPHLLTLMWSKANQFRRAHKAVNTLPLHTVLINLGNLLPQGVVLDTSLKSFLKRFQQMYGGWISWQLLLLTTQWKLCSKANTRWRDKQQRNYIIFLSGVWDSRGIYLVHVHFLLSFLPPLMGEQKTLSWCYTPILQEWAHTSCSFSSPIHFPSTSPNGLHCFLYFSLTASAL